MRNILLASVAALGVTAAASAQDATGPYAGAGITQLNIDEIGVTGLTFLGGYQFNEHFSAEGELFLGLDGEDFSDGVNSASIDANYGVGVFAKASYPLGEGFEVFGRVGYATYEVEASANVPGLFNGSDSENFDGFAWGGGGEFAFNGPNAVRVDFTRYEISDIDDAGLDTPYSVTASYVRRF